jgi:hypothetical protein
MVYRVFTSYLSAQGPESRPEMWTVVIVGGLHTFNVVSLQLIYCKVTSQPIIPLVRGFKTFMLVVGPVFFVYSFYFIRRMKTIVAEFEDNAVEPIRSGPGLGFALYAVATVALCVASLAYATLQ